MIEYDENGEIKPGPWGDYGIGYHDRQGNRISMDRYVELTRDLEYKRVAQTDIDKLWISTVWLGFDHRFRPDDGDGGPLIFESMVFYDETDEIEFPGSDRVMVLDRISDPDSPKVQVLHPELRDYIGVPFRYVTEDEAIRGHDLLCIEIRTAMAKIEMAQQVHDAAVDEAARKALRRRDEK